MKRYEFLIGIGLLLAGTLFAFYLAAPYFQPGLNVGGDDPIHVSYNQELTDIVRETGKLFGWSYLYGAGCPIFIFRPPGYYLTVVALHLLSGGLVGVVLAHKIVTVAILALYPLAIFYFLRKFDFPPLASGIGALLALAPISTWGHTIDAYFDLALSKQAVAILLVPFTLGKLHGIMRKGEAIFPGALLFALVFLNHPYMAWSLVLLAGAYLICHLVAFPLAATARSAARVGATFALGILFIAFWLVPFYSSSEVHPTRPYGAGWRHSFSVIAETAAETVDHFVRGSLFDQAGDEVFGEGSVWSWRDNSGLGRWPALSWGAIIGLFFLGLGARKFTRAFLLFGFLFSFIVFLGPDDVTVLRLIPFQEQFQYIHWVPIPELFAIAAAAFGIWSLPRIPVKLVERLRSSRPLSGRVRNLIFYPALALTAFTFVFPIWRERARWASLKVRTRNFDLVGRRQSPVSLRHQVNRDYLEVTDTLADSGRFERFYASPTRVHAGLEIFFFTLTPPMVERTNVISPLFAGMKGGWNHIVGSTIRRDLWRSRALLDLLNIRYIVSSAGNRDHFPLNPEFMEEAVSNRNWFVYRVLGEPSSFGFSASAPVLCLVDYKSWEELNRHWPAYYRRLADPAEGVFLLKSPARRVSEIPPDKLARAQAVILEDFELGDRQVALYSLRRFIAEGGRVYSRHPVEGLPEARPLTGLDDISYLEESEGMAASWRLLEIDEERERHAAEVEVEEGGYFFLKNAYYRGWRVRVDGSDRPNRALSPGYNSVYLPPGRHRVEFAYAGANNALWGNLVSAFSFAAALAWFARGKLLRRSSRRKTRTGEDGE